MKKMKKMLALTLALLLGITLLTACGGNEPSESNEPSDQVSADAGDQQSAISGIVKTGGSTSVEKVMNALIYQYQAKHRDVTVNYEMNGSGDGIKNTLSGVYEIGHSSRELKTDGSEDGLATIPYAIDGIAIILHQDNQISNLTKEQLKDIYTGKITNWSELGGKDAPITVITREAGSGTRGAFAEIIGLEKKDSNGNITPETMIVQTATIADNTGAVQTTVAQNPNSIGYMSFSDVDTTKVKMAQYEGGAISVDALKDGSYKLKREFLMLTKTDAALSPAAEEFIAFVLSEEGQQIIADNKLIPTK